MPVDSAPPSDAITRWLLEWDRSGKELSSGSSEERTIDQVGGVPHVSGATP
jgi:hypothetical protein